MPHAKGHLRDPLIEAFDCHVSRDREWYKFLGPKAKALRLLGRLWNCTDTMPGSTRDAVAEWLLLERHIDEQLERQIRSGCSYAQVVRILIPCVRELPEWQHDAAAEPGGE